MSHGWERKVYMYVRALVTLRESLVTLKHVHKIICPTYYKGYTPQVLIGREALTKAHAR